MKDSPGGSPGGMGLPRLAENQRGFFHGMGSMYPRPGMGMVRKEKQHWPLGGEATGTSAENHVPCFVGAVPGVTY